MIADIEQREHQHVHRAPAGGGVALAYTNTGSTGLAIVNPVCHGSTLRGIEDTSAQRPFLRALGAGHQLVVYDQRGAGASGEAGAPESWRQRAEDLWAIADAAGVERAVLYGVFDAGHTIAHAATLHPERVLGLIFNRVPACFGAGPGNETGVASADLDLWFRRIGAERGGLTALMEVLGIGGGDAATLVEDWERTLTAQAASAQEELLRGADLCPLLPAIEAPALVLAPARRRYMGAWGAALSALLPRARLVRPENGGEALGALHAFLAVLGVEAGRRASKVAADLSGTMSASKRSIGAMRRILVPVDPNVSSGRAVELACRLGEAQQAEIVLAHVVAVPHSLPLDHPLPEAHRRGERALALGEAIVAEHGLRSGTRLLVGRSVAGCIISLAREVRADLIVMAVAGSQLEGREQISHTAQEVVRRAPCEVIIDDPGPAAFVEPARREPAHAEPAPAEPAHAEPAMSEVAS